MKVAISNWKNHATVFALIAAIIRLCALGVLTALGYQHYLHHGLTWSHFFLGAVWVLSLSGLHNMFVMGANFIRGFPPLREENGEVVYAAGRPVKFNLSQVKSVNAVRARRGFGLRNYVRVSLDDGQEVWIFADLLEGGQQAILDYFRGESEPDRQRRRDDEVRL